MKIVVNGEAKITDAKTLDELCRELDLADAKVATAQNGAFVPADARSLAALAEGDRIEVLSPRAGG